MKIKDFSQNSPRAMARAIPHGEVISLTYHGRPYAAVVPAEMWERAKAAMEREQEESSKAA